MWDYLYNKYFDTRASVNSIYLVDLITYKMDPEMQVGDAWIKVKRLRAKIVSLNKNIKKLFQILLRILPKKYKVIRDLMSTFKGAINEKIRIIQNKKDRLRNKNTVLAAFQKKFKSG